MEAFRPETHQTRCGAAWRILDVNCPVGAFAAVTLNGHEYDNIVWFDEEGLAYVTPGTPRHEYDLVPIEYPSVDFPTNLRPEIRYAAMTMGGAWYGFTTKPVKGLLAGDDCWTQTDPAYRTGYDLRCLDIPDDLSGWENSLHKRLNGKWERVA